MDLITPYFHWSRRGDLNPRPDDYELDRCGSPILAPVRRQLPALEKIGSGGDQISPRFPLLSPVWCTEKGTVRPLQDIPDAMLEKAVDNPSRQ